MATTAGTFFKEAKVSVLGLQFADRPGPSFHHAPHGGGPIQTGTAHPTYRGEDNILPHMSGTNSSAGAATTWQIRKTGHTLPMAISKQNNGSAFKFSM